MKTYKSIRYSMLLTIMTILFCYSSVVFAVDTSVTNTGSIGAVDISLNYTLDEENGNAILPNQTVGLKSSVTNIAEPIWLRMKIQYPVYENQEILEHLAEENLTELNDDRITFGDREWKKIGIYYYLEEPVETGETVEFTKSILFPSDWDNRLVNSKFGICITAEAIQESHFTPDFNSDDPWFGTVIEAYDSTDYIHQNAGSKHFSICYEGGAKGLIQTGDDFFSNWETLMPGDKVTGEAVIQNKMDLPVKLFFRMESNSTDEDDLLTQLHLTVKHKDKTIYDGNLKDGMKEILLQEYKAGESTSFSYELTVPETFTNTFAEKEFQTVWTFRAEEILPESTPVITTIVEKVPEKIVEVPEKIIEIVKTGNVKTLVHIITVIFLLIVCISIGIYFKKEGKKNEK